MVQNEIAYRILWGDTDTAGIVYYPNYFRWFDMATHEFFRSLGLTVKDLMLEQGIVLPILSAHSDFKTPLYYDNEVVISSQVSEIRNRAFRIDHVVTRGVDITGSGYEWRGWVAQQESGLKAVPIPEEVRRLLTEGL